MDLEMIIYLVLLSIMWIPLILISIKYSFLKQAFNISIAYAQQLGFLISINGSIRVGKTSKQSGLKHIFEILIENMILERINTIRKIYKSIDFNFIDMLIDQYVQSDPIHLSQGIQAQIKLDTLLETIINILLQKNVNLDTTVINNFLSNKTSRQLIEEYIFTYWVYNYRRNYVSSKTIFYSHITHTFSYDYNVEQTKIHKAYDLKEYAIYDYMVELIDEASDDIGQNKRFQDLKEEDGDKDYRRKFGQIHQERNWQITTKQDVKDEVAKFRRLTQSNIWISEKVSQRGTNRFILTIAAFMFNIIYFFYDLTVTRFHWIFSNKHRLSFEDFKEYFYKSINFKRDLDNFLLYLDWYLKSAGYNRYDIRVYANEEDVKSNDPNKFQKQVYYIPTKFCWGTYDTHKYRSIQHELLLRTTKYAKESNYFEQKPYFEERMKGDNHDKDVSDDFQW